MLIGEIQAEKTLVMYLDEIGKADKSPDAPLKFFHSILDNKSEDFSSKLQSFIKLRYPDEIPEKVKLIVKMGPKELSSKLIGRYVFIATSNTGFDESQESRFVILWRPNPSVTDLSN